MYIFQIHCTNILIGVHGAGMEWLQFLPANAAVLELGWNNWFPDQWRDMAIRRGLMADIQYAKSVSIDWAIYKKFNNITSPLTDEEKNRRMKEDKDPMWAKKNPFRYGLGTFDIKKFITNYHKITIRFSTILYTLVTKWSETTL